MNTRNENGTLKRAWRAVDTVFEAFCILCLVATLLIVLWQVFSRELLSNSPSWSEETARILLVWIGFLGAGAIIRHGINVRGLTTAASLWVVAAIGVSVGAGMYAFAVATTALVILALWPLSQVKRLLAGKAEESRRLAVTLEPATSVVSALATI